MQVILQGPFWFIGTDSLSIHNDLSDVMLYTCICEFVLRFEFEYEFKSTVHDYMYNVKNRQPDELYEPMLFEPVRQIRDIHSIFKGINFFF